MVPRRKTKKMKSPTVSRKISMRNVMWTWQYYYMHPIVSSINAGDNTTTGKFAVARGPILGSVLNTNVTSDSLFGNIIGTGITDYTTSTNVHARDAIAANRYMWTYVFAADYPFQTMLPMCQESTSTYHLTWGSVIPSTTTDPNLPIKLSDIVANKDWNRIVHGATYLYFDFTNYARQTMIVEVLLFKYVVDVDAMDYTQMIDAPLSRQYGNAYTSYCEMKNMNLGTKQIRVIKRIRFRMNVQKSFDVKPTYGEADGLRSANITMTPTYRKLRLKVKRQYTMKRPIATTFENVTDNQFFNTYYEYDKGTYCRVQAWPEDVMLYQVRESFPSSEPTTYFAGTEIDESLMESYRLGTAAETPTTSIYRIAQGVACYMEKKSFIKLDEPMLKGPFRS